MSRSPATCHPEKTVWGHGLCDKCYQRWYRGAMATCHPDQLRSRKHDTLCRPCYYEQVTKPKQKLRSRARKLLRYGLTPEQYDARLAEQGGLCAICGGRGGGRAAQELHVDHDHATGRVRGLLCLNCNALLGMAQDDPRRLEAAISYLGGAVA